MRPTATLEGVNSQIKAAKEEIELIREELENLNTKINSEGYTSNAEDTLYEKFLRENQVSKERNLAFFRFELAKLAKIKP